MKRKQQKVSTWPQWLAVLHVNMMTVSTSVNFGMLSPLLARLLGPSPPFKVTKEQTSWLAAMLHTTNILGPVVAMLTTLCIGSKATVHSCGLYLLGGALSLIFASSIEAIYVSFLFTGLAIGIVYSMLPVFIGEISDIKIRGGLITFAIDGFISGHLIGALMGTYLDLVSIGIFCLVVSGIYLVSLSFFPHTPYYLVSQNKVQQAGISMEWYNRGIESAAVTREIDRLHMYNNNGEKLTIKETITEMLKPENRNVLIKLHIALAIDKLSSANVLLDYLEIMFREAKLSVIAPSSMVIIINAVGLFTGWIVIYTSDRINRRTSIICASLVMAASFVAWGLCYHLQQLGIHSSIFQYVIIVASITYRMCYSLGLAMLITPIMSDMLAPNVRSLGVTTCVLNITFCLFVSTKTFQFLVDTLKYEYVFYLNATILTFLAVYVKVFLLVRKEGNTEDVEVKLDSDAGDDVLDIELPNTSPATEFMEIKCNWKYK